MERIEWVFQQLETALFEVGVRSLSYQMLDSSRTDVAFADLHNLAGASFDGGLIDSTRYATGIVELRGRFG